MSNKRGHHRRSGQNYERTDRVSGLVKEIVAGELERSMTPDSFWYR